MVVLLREGVSSQYPHNTVNTKCKQITTIIETAQSHWYVRCFEDLGFFPGFEVFDYWNFFLLVCEY